MSLSKEDLNGKTLQQCKLVLENKLTNYHQNVKANLSRYHRGYIDYSGYYDTIISSDISTNIKKSLMLAIHKFGIPLPSRWAQDCMATAYEQKDVSLIKFVSSLVNNNPSSRVITFLKNGITVADNQFIIQLLNELTLSLSLKKAILYNAIINRNMLIIKYITTQGIDLFVPTHKKINHVLGPAFAVNDDLELLQWFEDHEYNIHEGQRSLLGAAYVHKANRIIKYVLDRQAETDAANLFMEKISSQAFHNNDVSMLQRFPKIDFRVTQNTICTALSSLKPYLYIQVLFDRWIEILKVKKHKYGWSGKTSDGEISLFNSYHVTRFYKSSQYDNVWSLISNNLYKYGDTTCRTKLVQVGYTVGSEKQKIHTPTRIAQNKANFSDDEDEIDDEEMEEVPPLTIQQHVSQQVDNIESDSDDIEKIATRGSQKSESDDSDD